MPLRGVWPSDVLWSPAAPVDVALSLKETFTGTFPSLDDEAGGAISMHVPPSRRKKNSWRPVVKGTLTAAGGGTLIEVRYEMHPFVLIFTLVHGMFLFGISWLIGALAFSSGVKEARAEIRQLAGTTHEGAEALARVNADVVDPRDAGAAAGAPFSLRAQADMDGARFVVGSTRVRVGPAGVRVDGESIPWDSLVGVVAGPTPAGPTLELALASGRSVVVSGQGHPEADLQWLADYLQAQDARRSASADELDRARAESARLAAMRRT